MKKLIAILLSLLLLIQNIIPIQAVTSDFPELSCDHAIIMDVDTKQLIYSKDPFSQIAPASVTKIMTIIVALESGVSLDTSITVDTSLFEGIGNDDAQLNFSDNEVFTLRDMLYCAAVYSANDAANLVAQCVGGSIENFVEMMNQKAKEIGCENTHFANANGLDAEDHYSTTYDMCLIMAYGVQNEMFNTLLSANSYDLPATRVREAFTVYNVRNLSIMTNSAYYIPGIVSSKIGSTPNARACEISYIERDSKKFIIATFAGLGDETRAAEHYNLADYFCNNFSIIDVKQDYLEPDLDLPYIYAIQTTKNYYTVKEMTTMYAYNNAEVNKVTRTFKPIPIDSDTKIGDVVGYYVYEQNGEIINEQEVYLNSKIVLSIPHLLIVGLIGIISLILYVILVFISVGMINRLSKRIRRRHG